MTQQINDLILTLSLRACLDQCIGSFICEKNCLHEIEENKFREEFYAPNHDDILNIMTNDDYNDQCLHFDYQWTEWNSVTKSDTDDFETLLDHRRLYG